MIYFLEQVAQQIYSGYGSSLNRHTLVFPSRRAGVFMMKHLAALAGKPLWAPRTITINELFVECSGLKKASGERLIFELYRVYRTLAKTEETFDNFYFWGEMLLNDFDDIDKYLVDPRALFTNLSDLHAIDEKFGGLTPEQMEIIRQFIFNFRAGSESEQKRDFEFTWSVLFPLYTEFKKVLKEKALAYEGMIFREVLSEEEPRMPAALSGYEQYHFIGFNALNNCEKRLLKFLKREGKASFYWDYSESEFFREDPRAGFFIEQNIREFGQDLLAVAPQSDRREPAAIRIIDIPSDAGQAKLLSQVLDDAQFEMKPGNQHRTAVILADENLLPAVISSIPPGISDINVTMGYPFSMTVVYSLLKALLDLQVRPIKQGDIYLLDYRKVLPVLSNPLITRVAGVAASEKTAELIRRNTALVPHTFFDSDFFLSTLFRITADASSLRIWLHEIFISITLSINEKSDGDADDLPARDPLTPEFLYRAAQVLNRLEPLLGDSSVTITREIFIRLIDKIFREIKVPFRGEPLKGLQVMGLLESRALDFDNLIMLSVNEGILPKSSAGSSYIPYNLREAFGLPTISYHDSIYSYYFTRLMTRARRITFIYNSSAEGLRTGEMSRYLLRLKYSSRFSPEYISAYTRVNQRMRVPEERTRTEDDTIILERLYLAGENSSPLSPSAINTWLACSMKFYYAYVCGLREPDRITTGMDPARFGTILHEVVSRIYEPYRRQVVTAEIIESLKRRHSGNREIINGVLRDLYYGGTGAPVTGTGLVTADITEMFLRRVLNMDSRFAPFTVEELEESFRNLLLVSYKGSERELFLGGKIDRIDEKDGVRRLIDYKTGTADTDVASLEDLFNSNGKKLNSAVVQTMIYCVIMTGRDGYGSMRPVIYTLRSGSISDFDDRIRIGGMPVDDFSQVSGMFNKLLNNTLESIFDPLKPFTMTPVADRCLYCPFKNLCQR